MLWNLCVLTCYFAFSYLIAMWVAIQIRTELINSEMTEMLKLYSVKGTAVHSSGYTVSLASGIIVPQCAESFSFQMR